MNQTPAVTILGPGPDQKRKQAAERFITGGEQLDRNSLRERLREIRKMSARKSESYVQQLQDTAGRMTGVTVSYAHGIADVVKLVSKYGARSRPISVNKSSVVLNEIRPELVRAGFKTYLRYFSEFENFSEQTFRPALNGYWSLPGLSEKGISGSWSVQQSLKELPRGGRKDYVALLGVNCVSASDAGVHFLQHMSNISKDLEQAETIIFVAGIDKIVEDESAAMVHCEAMGQFGLESMLLDIAPFDIEKYDFDALPAEVHDKAPSIHFILFDNGRSDILKGDYSDLFLCIDCRACARQCPVGSQLTKETGLLYSPKNYLLSFLQHKLTSIEGCLHCGRCQAECPLDIDVPYLLWKSQLQHYATKGRSLKKRILDNPEALAKLGSWTAPLSGWLMKVALVKYLIQLTAGIHQRSPLPEFHRSTFRKWFRREARV